MEKIKILHIVEAFGGGIFTYLQDLSNALVEQYDIYIMYAARTQTPKDYKERFDNRITFIESAFLTREVDFRKDFRALKEIKCVVREIKPNLIHLHSSKAGVLGRWAINGCDIPVFYTPHGYSFLMQDRNCITRFLYWGIETISAKRACTTISCSLGEHQESLRLTSWACHVDNGIDTAQMDELLLENKKREDQSFTVFTTGRICYQKNPELFNQIAAAMPDVRFLWIGDGELRSELTASNIEITGWVDRQAVLEKSVGGDVFLLTSLWEGLPISLLEAMYMKKLCVVSDVVGNHDVIKNGQNGFVCKSLSDFKNAIYIARDGDTEALVTSAYQDILLRYNTETMVQKYKLIYSDALLKTGGGNYVRLLCIVDTTSCFPSAAANRKEAA